MIKVLLADDQALVRGAMGALLDLEPDIEVVAQAGRGDEVVAAARESGADVCLLDIQMPGVDGVEAARQVRDQLPEVRVVMVTTFDRPGYLRRALDAGAVGFVVKTTPAARLAEAVRRAHAGLRTVDPQLANDLLFSGPNPPDRQGTGGVAPGPGRGTRREAGPETVPVPGDGAQPPLQRHRQDGRGQPGGGGTDRHRTRLVVNPHSTSRHGRADQRRGPRTGSGALPDR